MHDTKDVVYMIIGIILALVAVIVFAALIYSNRMEENTIIAHFDDEIIDNIETSSSDAYKSSSKAYGYDRKVTLANGDKVYLKLNCGFLGIGGCAIKEVEVRDSIGENSEE